MSTIERLRCDRCGTETDKPNMTQWATVTNARFCGSAVLGDGNQVDLCEPCADSLAAWYVNPQQFRQLHDVAEATLLWFAPPPWTNPQRAKWTELTGADDANTKTLCDAIRKALAHQEENDDATRNT